MAEQKHPLDSLIVVFETLRTNTEASSRCLLAVSALVAALTDHDPTFASRYTHHLEVSTATSPEARSMRAVLQILDESIREMRDRRESSRG